MNGNINIILLKIGEEINNIKRLSDNFKVKQMTDSIKIKLEELEKGIKAKENYFKTLNKGEENEPNNKNE